MSEMTAFNVIQSGIGKCSDKSAQAFPIQQKLLPP
jgi:hypothetical protein